MFTTEFLRSSHVEALWQGLYFSVSHYYIDIDECLDNNGSCSHECVNTVGSYYCECPTGHHLQPNNHDCEGEYY